MRIIQFQAENIKKLKAVTINPEASGVTLSGPNESGKTSTLDAIEMALMSGHATKRNPEPIRRGEDHAFSLVTLGDPTYDDDGTEIECKPSLIVSRKWTGNDKSYLTVSNADGATFKSPQSILDALIGDLTFDPLAFSSLKDKAQLEMLIKISGIGIDLDVWETEYKQIYEERTEINREVSRLQARVDGVLIADDIPDTEISLASILDEQQKAQATIDGNKAKRQRACDAREEYDQLVSDRETSKAEIKRLEDALVAERMKLAGIDADIVTSTRIVLKLNKIAGDLIDPDLSVFRKRADEIEAVNRQVRAKQDKIAMQESLGAAQERSKAATKRLLDLNNQKAQALSDASMPVPELSVSDQGVTYRGIPFCQCSAEERLRVSVAMGMALNPKLRVMFVRDGSLLDSSHRSLLQQMAADNQYQLWMEVADDTGSVGIYFEDGEIVGAADVPAKPAIRRAGKGRKAKSLE